MPADADLNRLVVLFNAGRYAELESSVRSLLEQYPDSGFCWKALGLALQAQGKDALAALKKAAQLLPQDPEAQANLGNVLKDLGRFDDAVATYRRALAIDPAFVAAHYHLAQTLVALEQFEVAAECYRQILKMSPDHVESRINLGAALQALGRHGEAADELRQALQIKPGDAIAHNNLGNALRELGQIDAATASFRRALEIQPDYADAHNNLGVALQMMGRFDEAMACYRRVIGINPDDAVAHYNLGYVLKEQGLFEAAMAEYRKALTIDPGHVDAHNNLGLLLQEIGQLVAAQACFRHALAINPEYAEAYNNLGNALRDMGRHADAIASFRRALSIRPDFTMAWSNLLFSMNYSAGQMPANCVGEARRFGAMVAGKVANRFQQWQCEQQPVRLRVGMVSGDLRKHPVGYFLENLLLHLDPERIDLIAYPTHHLADELTDRLRPHFAAWKPVYGLNDEAAARLIHDDGVHVLLDLSGHTAKNRLPMFAWKPAPVQASWLGYFATTGLAEIDYFIADEAGVPPAQRNQFTENVICLPDTRWCFTPPDMELPIADLPALEKGYLTFGCFQNLAKVGEGVLAAWAAIMARLPTARLRWQCRQFGDPKVLAQCIERLKRHGIDTDRVTLHGLTPRSEYLVAHVEVDAILDTFPFTGGTTTCEALWMGVPTVTIAGETLVARQSASLLGVAGLPEWVAGSVPEYIDKAVGVADDLPRLAALRAGLRACVLTSPIFDAPRFARNFEAALWEMWRKRQTHQ